MLEAFVYDPLISWRLLKSTKNDMINAWDAAATGTEEQSTVDRIREQLPTSSVIGLSMGDDDEGLNSVESGLVARSMAASMKEGKTVRKHGKSIDEPGADSDADTLNARALEVITRIQAKLTGRDFVSNDDDDDLKVDEQVYELIKEATSEENLCQLYIGWCALW
jgi:FKBP12-rapamycin complex-associated protein